MKTFQFEAKQLYTVYGTVSADNESQAFAKVRSNNYDDITNTQEAGPLKNISITNSDDLDEGIEINKKLTKKDILAIIATLTGELSAIAANANPKTSMYTMYIEKAMQDVKKAEQILKTETTKTANTKDVKFNLEESKNFNY